MTLESGARTGTSSGDLTIETAAGGTARDRRAVTLQTGVASNGNKVTISNTAGVIEISAGASSTTVGSAVTISGGDATLEGAQRGGKLFSSLL